MRDEGVIYVAGHPLLNRRCKRLPGCICLRNDLYCVGWGVKPYSLTYWLVHLHSNLTQKAGFIGRFQYDLLIIRCRGYLFLDHLVWSASPDVDGFGDHCVR